MLGLAVLSGLGFGLYFVFLARAGDESGLWPLLVSRFASAVAIVPIARARGSFARLSAPTLGLVALAGACDAPRQPGLPARLP